MNRFHRAAAQSVPLVLSLLGCAQSDSTVTGGLEPGFDLKSARAFASFDPIRGTAACVAPPATTAEFATYQPFVVPQGYTQRIVATELADFAPVAGASADNPDMMTLNENGPDANRYLYRTHEVGSNGAVTRLDLQTGVTTLVTQEPHYEALDGIVWTPWGTLLFAEERTVASFPDPRVPNAVGGLVYEYNPGTGQTRPLPAVGARSHEGLRFDAAGNLYGISESTPGTTGSGAVYKFTPDVPGDLTSGQLYALKVTDPSRTGAATWVALDRAAVQINSDAEAVVKGATGWGRPEDVEILPLRSSEYSEALYVAATSEALVLRIALAGPNAFVSNFVKEGVNVTGLNTPDNLELDEAGNLYVLEDNGPGDIWFVRNDRRPQVAPRVVQFASLSDCSAEPTGLYFAPTGDRVWVHVQHAGGILRNDLLVEIAKR